MASAHRTGKRLLANGLTKQLAKLMLKVSTWNVRTLQQCGKPELIVSALHHYNVDIAYLQEVCFSNNGSLAVLGAGTDAVYEIFHGGCTNGQFGVAIAIKSHLSASVIEFKEVRDRIRYLTLKSKPFDVTRISA
jgi:exonuclease III